MPDEIRQTAYKYLKEIMDIPILNSDSLIKIQVTFGYANIGASIIWIYNSNNELIAQFRGNKGSSYELPKLDFRNTEYFKVVIAGTSVDINRTTNRGKVTITFSQGKYVIATKILSYTFNEDGDTNTFTIEGILHL